MCYFARMSKPRKGQSFADPLLKTLIGGDFIKRLTESEPGKAPLRIGSQVWSTHRLATELGVVHTRAARLLTLAADAIGAKNVKDLYARSSPYSFAGVQGLGETTLYVLWRLFESQGLDPDRWAAGTTDDALVSFRSMKLREQKAEQRTRDAAKRERRTQARRTHEAAVKQHVTAKEQTP